MQMNLVRPNQRGSEPPRIDAINCVHANGLASEA
jgi:hypothetical protein